MIVTESEARAKWCPMVTADDVPVEPDGKRCPRCIASLCMAWRDAGDIWMGNHVDKLRGGYCGLAGVPTEPRVAP